MKSLANKKSIRRELDSVIPYSIFGTVFFLLMLIVFIIVCVRDNKFIIPLFCILMFFYIPGLFSLIVVFKKFIKYFKAKNCITNGIELTATIFSTDKIVLGGAHHAGHMLPSYSVRVSFVLNYDLNGKEQKFKTTYMYTKEEYEYLISLAKIKIKVKNGFAVIVEEIYAKKPKIKLTKKELEKIEKGRLILIIALIIFLIFIALGMVLKLSILGYIGMGILFAAAIGLAIYAACK